MEALPGPGHHACSPRVESDMNSAMNSTLPPSDPDRLPVLTDVIEQAPRPHHDLLGPAPLDTGALERRLVEELSQRLRATLEGRVHASVAPAVSLLADRIAYKAAQEVAGDLVERMQDDLQASVRQALQDAMGPRS